MGEIIIKRRYYTTEDGVYLPKFTSNPYTKECYKFYENVSYKLVKLNKAQYLLFHFICEEMDKSNNIVHTMALRSKFISHMRKNCNIDYKDETVKKSFMKLVKVGLIINYDQKSDFTVNPRHVFKGSEESRKTIIQTLIHEMDKLTITRSNYKQALGIK